MARLPITLCLVAGPFKVSGIAGVWNAVEHWSSGQLWVPLDVICIFIGYDLLRRKRGWRTCALVLLWLEVIILLVFSADLAFSVKHTVTLGSVPAWLPPSHDLVAAQFAAAVLLTFWSIYVLGKSEIAALFQTELQAEHHVATDTH